MYKSVSLFAIHLKSDENTIPKSIFDLLRISSMTKGRINNILRSIEVYYLDRHQLFLKPQIVSQRSIII